MTTRLFVALPIPDAIAFDLEGMAYGLPGARPVPPENLHITLRFIGEVDGGLARGFEVVGHRGRRISHAEIFEQTVCFEASAWATD